MPKLGMVRDRCKIRCGTSKYNRPLQATMRHLGRRGFIMLGLVAIAVAPLGIFGRFFGGKRLRFPYMSGSLPAPEYHALAAKSGWSASEAVVAPGISLNGLVRRPKDPGAPWVLFYQGNDAHLLRVGQEFLSALAADRDWGLAVYAYRGYESSGGETSLTNLAADARRSSPSYAPPRESNAHACTWLGSPSVVTWRCARWLWRDGCSPNPRR